MTNYFEQLDKFLAPGEQNRFISGADTGNSDSNKPLVSIKKLGSTFAEKGRGNETVLQSLVSSIRQGRGQLQLAMQHDYRSPVGGGIASIGKSQRQAIKEVIAVSGVEWEGLEMPTASFSNVSGMDPQRGGFSEQKRAEDLRHIKDAIQFTAEIGAGGNVDVWSQEFQRDISSASFQKNDPNVKFEDFKGYDENKHATRLLVDDRTGQAVQMSAQSLGGQGNPTFSVPIWERNEKGEYVDAEGNALKADSNNKDFVMSRTPKWNEAEGKFESKQMNWTEFKTYTEGLNKEQGTDLSPEEWWQRIQLENSYGQQRAQAIYHTQRYNTELKNFNKMLDAKETFLKLEEGKSEDELIKEGLLIPTRSGHTEASQLLTPEYKKKSQVLQEDIDDMKRNMKHTHESSGLADAQAEAIWQNIQHIKPVEEYAKDKTFSSYAELGMYAMEQTKQHNPAKPIAVGPELGWPQAYGGHTDEFIEIVEGSRKKMIEQMRGDSRFARKDDKELKALAKKHINGVLDTSHLSMWYNHFPEKKGETEEGRLKRFNKWYVDQMDKLADAGVVGSVQIVDSASGAHRHLPVGEGIFPTVDAVKRLREKGWDGAILSEGHEDEPYDPGSTQYSLWNAFGASMGNSSYFGVPRGGNSFGNVYSGNGGAAGYRAPPNYIVGGYSPSNEWKIWSEVPLE